MIRAWFYLVFALTGVVFVSIIACYLNGSSQQDSKSVPAVANVPASVEGVSPTKSEPAIRLPAGVEIKFENVTDRAGIRFLHFDGRTETEYIKETMGLDIGCSG